jgi:hypothetical protein
MLYGLVRSLKIRCPNTLQGDLMKNNECVIKFLNKDGRVLQSFQRDKDGWFQTSSKGIVRRCTAEQTLSHLLSPLAGASKAIVKVERILPNK